MEIENIAYFLASPPVSGGLLILKILFLTISFIILSFIFFALAKTTWLRRIILEDLTELLTYKSYGARKLAKAWAKITKRLETGLEAEYKLAVIEANSMLQEVLERMGYKGETLGEKLDRLTPVILPGLNEVREVHRIRDNIVHDPDYKLRLDEAKEALTVYEKALSDLQAF